MRASPRIDRCRAQEYASAPGCLSSATANRYRRPGGPARRPQRGGGHRRRRCAQLFDVPRRTNPAVKNVEPGKAMPIPFTNACGECHDVDGL
jgi:hypothetical protein